MDMIKEIREKQNQLIVMINTMFDELVRNVENLKMEGNNKSTVYESIYPITNTTGFKGKKPIAVEIGNIRKTTPTWKVVVETILKEVLKDSNMRDRMFNLRDKLLGRKGKRLSKDEDGMHSPLKLENGLYIEMHYDTETLMNLLLQILTEISYDYNNIRVVIKN